MAFHYLRVGFSRGAEICIKVLDFGSAVLDVGMGSTSWEEFILLMGTARPAGLEITAVGARTRV